MATRKGIGTGMGKGYKNLVFKDPLIHSLSRRGITTNETVTTPFNKNFKDFIKKESELFDRYAVYKSAEKSKLYRTLRLKQLEKRAKFYDTMFNTSETIVKHMPYNFVQNLKETVSFTNKYGSRKFDITPPNRILAQESKTPFPKDRGFNTAQTIRWQTEYGKQAWKKVVLQMMKERDWVQQQIKYINNLNEADKLKIKIKKKNDGEKATFADALKLTPIGRLFDRSGQQ